MENFLGEYKLVSSENYEEILQEMGLDYEARKIASLLKPTIIISKEDDDKYRIKTINKYHTSDIVFELSKEFDELRYDGGKMKSTITIRDNKLVHIMNDGARIIENVRELTDDGMKSVTKYKHIVSTRIYSRVQ